MDHEDNNSDRTLTNADLASVVAIYAFAAFGAYTVAKLAKDWTVELAKTRNAKKNQKTA